MSHVPQTQLIEKTSKRYKAMQLIGFVLLILGGVAAYTLWQWDMSNDGLFRAKLIGSILAACGFSMWVSGGILAWWHHG